MEVAIVGGPPEVGAGVTLSPRQRIASAPYALAAADAATARFAERAAVADDAPRPRRLYVEKRDGTTTWTLASQTNVELPVPGLTGLVIPGADGQRRYRPTMDLATGNNGAADPRTSAHVSVWVGPNGTANGDERVLIAAVTSENINHVSHPGHNQIGPIEITPPPGGKWASPCISTRPTPPRCFHSASMVRPQVIPLDTGRTFSAIEVVEILSDDGPA